MPAMIAAKMMEADVKGRCKEDEKSRNGLGDHRRKDFRRGECCVALRCVALRSDLVELSCAAPGAGGFIVIRQGRDASQSRKISHVIGDV